MDDLVDETNENYIKIDTEKMSNKYTYFFLKVCSQFVTKILIQIKIIKVLILLHNLHFTFTNNRKKFHNISPKQNFQEWAIYNVLVINLKHS